MFANAKSFILLNHIPLLVLNDELCWQPNCAAERIVADPDITFRVGNETTTLDLLAQTCPDTFESRSQSGTKMYRWRRIPCERYRAAYYGEDISGEYRWKRRAAEIRLLHPLTRLPNFAYTLQKLAAWESNQPVWGIRIGLLNLAVLNELYGEECGNAAIKEIAQSLNTLVKEKELFLSQLSGNQFLIVGQLDDPDTFVAALQQHLTTPFTLPDGHLFHPRVMIGWARTLDLSNPAKTIEHLHLAQKHASRTQRPAELTPEWVAEHEHKIRLEMALRRALSCNEFELYFQPKFDARRQQVDSCEALIRWHHPKRASFHLWTLFLWQKSPASSFHWENGCWIRRSVLSSSGGQPMTISLTFPSMFHRYNYSTPSSPIWSCSY